MPRIRVRTILTAFLLETFLTASKAQTTNPVGGWEAYRADTVSAESPRDSRVAIKTNLLYDAFLLPNVGVEFGVGKRWTVAIDWFYTWFSSDRRHRYWQGYGGYLTVRRYFVPYASTAPTSFKKNFTGHHLGAYILGLTYDVEWGGRGYQAARFGFGAGLEYGYSVSIGKRLCLDFSIGMGFQDGEYKEYDPTDDGTGHYVWQSTRKRHWWGPTKAEVTLKWVLGKKGGSQ